jgi:hypothetical protein
MGACKPDQCTQGWLEYVGLTARHACCFTAAASFIAGAAFALVSSCAALTQA